MDGIEIKLTGDEAVVLFEFLSRFSDSEQLTIADQAEKRALWNLTCSLEKTLVGPLEITFMSRAADGPYDLQVSLGHVF